MPARIDPHTTRDLVRIRVDGPLGLAEARRLVGQVIRSHPGKQRLWDLCESSLTDWTLHEMRACARAHRSGPSGTRAAALVSAEVDYGLARMFEMVTPPGLPVEYKAFRDEEEAERWLCREDEA